MSQSLHRAIARSLVRSLVGVLGADIINRSQPAISGLVQEGETVTAHPGSYLPSPDGITYQWYSGGVAIVGATAATYMVQSGQLGESLQARIIATSGEATLVNWTDTRVVRIAHLGGITIGSYTIGA
ncbi:MAG: hypothetical protein Aurels2KO_10500 [Aureliella sp.]